MDLAKIRKKARTSSPRQAAPKSAAPPEVSAPQTPEETREAERLPLPAAPEPAPTQSPVAAEPEARPGTGERLLIFDVAREQYAIAIRDIAQVIDVPALTPIPNAPAFLLGIFPLRGKIVSVVDAGLRLGFARRDAEQGKIIVLEVGQDHMGLRVDRIDQVAEVRLDALEAPPEAFGREVRDFVEGVFHLHGRPVGFLSLPLVFAFDI